MKNKLFKNSICIIISLCIYNISNAQKNDTLYCNFVDSILKINAKISIKIIGNFELIKQQSSSNINKIEFKSDLDYLTVKTYNNIEDSSARKIMEDKKFLIDNLFKTQPSPYPDVVSNSVNCPNQFKPIPYENHNINMWFFAYKIYANDRFIFGECADDEVFYTSLYIFIYNRKSKILNEIKYFTPKSSPVNKPEKLIGKISCIN